MNQLLPTKLPIKDDAWFKNNPDESPQTDPTNPWHQEAAGIFVLQEHTSDRKINEPGLTERDREDREPKG
jgi:hypothetical protein